MRIKEIEDEEVIFDDGSKLYSDHKLRCCEWHWLDFSILKYYNVSTKTGKTIDIYQQEFDFSNGVTFKKVEDVGILLYDKEKNAYLINGYGSNNGNYETDIILIYEDKDNKKLKYDISECQEIEWD